MRYTQWPSLGLLVLIAGNGCSKKVRLTGGGSSFVNPIMIKWTGAYKDKTGVLVDYTSSGSGAGVDNMINGQNTFGCTDAPLTDEQIEGAGGKDAVVQVPLVMGAVVPIYNLKGTGELKLTGPVLAEIYLGTIDTWDHESIQKLNPGTKLPEQKITRVRRADPSGTSYIFTDYLSQVSSEWRKKVGEKPSTSPDWPRGTQGESKNPAVAKAVASTPGAIGYVELIYALENKDKLSIALVKNAAGEYVPASLDSVTKAAEGMLKKVPEDLRFSLVNPPNKGAYPISGTVWAVRKAQQPDGLGKPLADFLRWCLHEGQDYTREKHYARLPKGLIELAEKKIDRIK